MSGVEILGIAASVLQIADLGGKLSVKLFTFSRKIKNANKGIDSVSQDIAATGAVLQQLGIELTKDEKTQLCSSEAVATAQQLVEDCRKIFHELNGALDGGKGQSRNASHQLIMGWKERLKYPFLEPQIELLRSNLERLKSSLVVMLNVLIYAEQLKNREALPLLRDQRELIKTLVEDKTASEKRFARITQSIEGLQISPAAPEYSEKQDDSQNVNNLMTVNAVAMPAGEPNLSSARDVKFDPDGLPPGLAYRKEEIDHHCTLVNNLIREISAVQYKIDHGLRHNMHQGVLGVHWNEWSKLRKIYEDEHLLKIFSPHGDVVRFWMSRLEEESSHSKQQQQQQQMMQAQKQLVMPQMQQMPPPFTQEMLRQQREQILVAQQLTQQRLGIQQTQQIPSPPHQLTPAAAAAAAAAAATAAQASSPWQQMQTPVYQQAQAPLSRAPTGNNESAITRQKGNLAPQQKAWQALQMQAHALNQASMHQDLRTNTDQMPSYRNPELMKQYEPQLRLLKFQNKKRLGLISQDSVYEVPPGTDPSIRQAILSKAQSMPTMPKADSTAPQDYQMQLMLLEQQNKKRLMMARQEQGEPSRLDQESDMLPAPEIHPHDSPAKRQKVKDDGVEERLRDETIPVAEHYSPGPSDAQYNLDFSRLDGDDVLNDFDFDTFLNEAKRAESLALEKVPQPSGSAVPLSPLFPPDQALSPAHVSLPDDLSDEDLRVRDGPFPTFCRSNSKDPYKYRSSPAENHSPAGSARSSSGTIGSELAYQRNAADFDIVVEPVLRRCRFGDVSSENDDVLNPPARSRPRFRSKSDYPTLAESTIGEAEAGRTTSNLCPLPECGRRFRDLKAHMLTHQSELPKKCPVSNCDYNKKGFTQKYDKNRHTLTHFKGAMVCGFCPSSGASMEKRFNRADVFKRHVVSVHGARPLPPSLRQESVSGLNERGRVANSPNTGIARCSNCSIGFNEVQAFYDHLDDCVLNVILQEESKGQISEPALSSFGGAQLTGSDDEDDEDDEVDQDDEDDEHDELVQEALEASALEDRTGPDQRRTAESLDSANQAANSVPGSHSSTSLRARVRFFQREKRRGSGLGPFRGFKGLVVVQDGSVKDGDGNIVGRVLEGKMDEVVCKSVNEVGEVVDEDGFHHWGQCEPYEEPEEETTKNSKPEGLVVISSELIESLAPAVPEGLPNEDEATVSKESKSSRASSEAAMAKKRADDIAEGAALRTLFEADAKRTQAAENLKSKASAWLGLTKERFTEAARMFGGQASGPMVFKTKSRDRPLSPYDNATKRLVKKSNFDSGAATISAGSLPPIKTEVRLVRGGIERITPELADNDSLPTNTSEAQPREENVSRKRKREKMSHSDAVLISYLDPNRPGIAQQTGEEALEVESLPEGDGDEDFDLDVEMGDTEIDETAVQTPPQLPPSDESQSTNIGHDPLLPLLQPQPTTDAQAPSSTDPPIYFHHWKPPAATSAVDQTDAMPFYSKQATPRTKEGEKMDDGVELDWSKVDNPHTRRKIQNRLAQRKFRDSRRRLVETGKYEETWSARDVVDELLEQWTTLSTAEMVDARKEVVDNAGFVTSRE